ncbi:MAG: hypothetical protein Q9169_006022 [Polycauliona sp. 2 TL-2023]
MALRRSLKRLERISESDKKDQTSPRHIVDPGLYPMCFGLTRYFSSPLSSFEDCMRRSGKGVSRNLLSPSLDITLDERNIAKIDKAFSTKHQWLPCDVSFEEETGKACINSYINNVHPVFDRHLHTVANELLSAIIPMLNSTLMVVKTSNLFYPRIDPENRISRKTWPDPEPGPYRSHISRLRSAKPTKNGNLPTSVRVDLQKEFWDIGVQTVIQVSSIDLDEERPEYPGEDWHVQETTAAEDVYGVKHDEPAVQEYGSVMIQEGRAISFPNVFQTKINPIELLDPAKTGHLKLFVVHLIDPNRRIMSTSMVPCQRRDWWAHEIRQKSPVLRRLPRELFDKIIEMVDDFPISATKAEELRKEMEQERAELGNAFA